MSEQTPEKTPEKAAEKPKTAEQRLQIVLAALRDNQIGVRSKPMQMPGGQAVADVVAVDAGTGQALGTLWRLGLAP